MRAIITGATGLVGSNLAIALLEQGHEVRCTARPTSRKGHLAAFDIEWVEADLEDSAALELAFRGGDVVFHCAAAVRIVDRIPRDMVVTNIDGTRRVLDAVRRADVRRLVHCSTVAATAIAEGPAPVTEEDPFNVPRMGLGNAYALTKYESQQLVLAAARDDVDAVVVNPTYMFGPYDPKPSSGQMIQRIAEGRIPVYAPGINNYSDVRDVCRGMISAWAKGRRGEKYILGGENLTYSEIFARIARVLDVAPPRFPAPKSLATMLGLLGDLKQRLSGRDSLINSATIRFAFSQGCVYSSDKAIRELDYTISPLDEAIADGAAWLRQAGMLR